ncbi:MAG: hypothetical protein HY575_07070 [candidate division NC10 bacterium]|nr:hypothetical protein [candidate division NC10 bacterium]
MLAYLSTHPSTAGRIERLKAMAAQAPGPRVKLLPDRDWRDVMKICQVAAQQTGVAPRPRPAAVAPRPSRGVGRVYFVPMGEFPAASVEHLIAYYREKYGLAIETLTAVPLEAAAVDLLRQQLVAEELIALVKHHHPGLAEDPEAILIGLTAYDMYIREYTWEFAFAWRQDGRFAAISSARMDPENFGDPPDPDLLHTRLRKAVSKTIGLMHYRLPQGSDRNSVMYGPILGLDDLDSVGEEF